MDTSSQLAANMDDLAKLFQTRMESYEQRLQQAASPSSSKHPDLSALSCEFHEFKSFVWQTLSKLKTQTELLALGLDKHETFLRRKILLFHGLPENKNENLFDVITSTITHKLQQSEFTSNDLQSCHRLGAPSKKARAVLVRFRDLEQRRLVWAAKTALKDTGIVISEFLTKPRHEVFLAARRHFGVKCCWSAEGKITILLPDKSRRKIEQMCELNSLMASFPAIKSTTVTAMPAAKSGHGTESRGGSVNKLSSAAPSRRVRKA